MVSPDLLSLVRDLPPGELEAMANASNNATSFGEMAAPNIAKIIKEALLETGSSAADMLMRGALEEDQIPAAARIIVRELWVLNEAGVTLPKGLQELKDFPPGLTYVIVMGLLQAAAKGNARAQTLQGLTGGMLFGGHQGGTFRKRMHGLFGRNGHDESGMIS